MISTMTNKTILVQKLVEAMLHSARWKLARDGGLQPVLYVLIVGDTALEMPLTLPDTSEMKAKYFFGIGRHLHERGLQPREAVLVSESWFVAVRQAPAAMDFPPSEHPSRQEAIVLIGRSADNRRFTQVVQPFTRDKQNRPVWQAMPMAVYDETQTPGKGSAGLLDYFFEAVSGDRR